ncbi:MAG: glycosyltransferase family 4 protein [Christensenellaceae bacterium]|jgi:glycosyltransferase involved in cell wall biosynthesis
MKIQVVSQYFHPDNFRINEIVAELTQNGHEISVLTGLPDYANGRIPKEYKWFKKRKESWQGAKINRVTTIARRKGVIFRALNYFSFMFSGWLRATFQKKPDCDAIFVYQTSPVFQAVPAIKLKKRTKKKLVLYCCDLWPESLKAWGVKETSFLFKMVKRYSARLYKKCDVIAVTSKPFITYLTEVCGIDENKIIYLPQHAEDMFADIVGQYEENDCYDFLFAGNIGAVQNLDIVLRAAAQVQTDAPYKIHLVGDGSEVESLKVLASELNIADKVVFHGRFPLEDMPRFYKMADCFLLTLRGGDFIGMTLPVKSQSYLSIGKPVLGVAEGAIYELISELKCGRVVNHDDIEALALSMKDMIENEPYYRQQGLSGRAAFEADYTKEKFISSLLSILQGA